MEQIKLFTNKNWKDIIETILSRIESEEELPRQSLVLTENYSDNKDRITSYSVALKKSDYPRGTNSSGSAKTSLFNIQPKINSKNEVEDLFFCLSDDLAAILSQKSFDISCKKRKSDVFTRVLIDPLSDSLEDFSYFVVKTELNAYLSKASYSFGCCARYKECSDAKKCLHENRLYALGCAYYHNLKEGRIFYGDNKNV